MRIEVGDRVGAFASANSKQVQMLGYGTYVGRQVPPERCALLHEAGISNPRIDLDNGDTVYGCECWWGAAAKIEAKIAEWRAQGIEVVDVRVADLYDPPQGAA